MVPLTSKMNRRQARYYEEGRSVERGNKADIIVLEEKQQVHMHLTQKAP